MTLATLWRDAGLAADALDLVSLTGTDPLFPSSFAVGAAAQSTIALAALAACELGHVRGAARLAGRAPQRAARAHAGRLAAPLDATRKPSAGLVLSAH